MAAKKDSRLQRASVSGYNKPKRTPKHPKKSHIVVAKEGDKVGNFTFIRTELVGKNKTWIMRCVCGQEKRFWKYSSITKQKTCGCGVDEVGNTKEQRRMLNTKLNSYKSGARKRGFEWSLTYKEFYKITSKDCFYCGGKPKKLNYFENAPSLQRESPNKNWSLYEIYFNGVDRFDSSSDYTVDNCVPCCTNCNRAKSDMNFEEFRNHVKNMYEWLYLIE